MKRKTEKGITLVEIMVSVLIITILFFVATVVIRPVEMKKRARDERRLSDIVLLDRAIGEFLLDNTSYPGASGVLYKSTALPQGSSGPLENPASGWIKQNLSSYLTRLATDPINDETYFYSYKHTGTAYEINVGVEYHLEYAVNSFDGGNNDNVYEVGNDLTIL